MKKRLLSMVLALSVLMGSMPVYALEQEPPADPAGVAEEVATGENAAPATEEDQTQPQDAPAQQNPEEQPAEEVVTEEITVDASDLPDNDELFAIYLQQQMYPGSVPSTYGDWGQTGNILNADELAVYNTLREYIGKVARGEVSSTQDIALPFEHTWTYEELGLTGQDDASLSTKLGEALQQVLNLSKIVDCLLVDCPAELYWFDKITNSVTSYTPGSDGTSITVSGFVISLPVAGAYGTGNPYEADTAKTGAANTVLANAQAIVDANAGKTTYEKLLAYKNKICELTGYNHEAADNSATPYGDPWQLIYVFDENPDTTVVCEGYSKSFQYLCDLSGIDCYTVNGEMEGGTGAGSHMWNIVPLEGQNYLVDVTNCDEGTVGSPDQLFLAGTAGSVAEGYTFTLNNGLSTIAYTYYDDCKALYGEGPLTLAATGYDPSQAPHEHSYDADGFCTCGQYQPAGLVDDVYQIANAGNLFWFAALVNGDTANAEFEAQDTAASAVLTQDIDLQSKAWSPIGAQTPGSAMYTGTFDGKGYAIRNLQADGQWAALFSAVGTGGVVQNLTVSGTVTGSSNVGGICATNNGTIRNCCSEAAVTATGTYAGGIAETNSAGGVIENCCNFGTVAAGSEFAGGICAYNNGVIRNSYSAGPVSATGQPETAGGIAGMNYQSGSIENSYYQEGTAPAGAGSGSFNSDDAREKSVGAFRTGEVTWLLNIQAPAGNFNWYQNLDNGQTVDEYPVLAASHGIVYAHSDGSYSNTDEFGKREQEPLVITGLPETVTYGDKIPLECTGGSGNGGLTWTATGSGIITSGRLYVNGVGGCTVTVTKAGDNTYNETSTQMTITARPKTLTVEKVSVDDKDYDGTADVQISNVWFSGTVEGDIIELRWNTAKAVVDSADAGTYEYVTLTGLQIVNEKNDCYTLEEPIRVPATVTIRKIAPQTPAGPLNATYGDTLASLSLPDGWQWENPGTVLDQLGTQTYTAHYTESTNYTAADAQLQVTVSAKAITPTVTVAEGAVFDGSAQQPAVIVRDGDTVLAADNYTVAYSDNVNAGQATVTVSAVQGSGYTFDAVVEHFTIAKAAALHPQDRNVQHRYTVTGEQTLELAGTMPANAGTVSYAAATKEDENGLVTAWSVDAAGKVRYTLSGQGAAGDTAVLPVILSSGNYADTTVRVVLTMESREIPQASASPYSKTYDGQVVRVEDLTLTADVPGNWRWKDAAPADVADSGTYTLTFTPDDLVNYGPVEVPVEITIAKAAVQITQVPQVAANLTYNGREQALLAAAGSAKGGTVMYALAQSGLFSEELPTATNAGNYTVWYKVAGDANHEDTQPESLTVMIDKATPQTPGAVQAAYGDRLSDYPLPDGWQWKDASQRLLQAGENQVEVLFPETENYKETQQTILVKVSPLDIQDTQVSLTAASLAYNGTKQAPDVSQVAFGDIVLDASADYTVNKQEGLNVGSYTITVTGKGNLTGSVTLEYRIVPRQVDAVLTAQDKPYDGTTDAAIAAAVSTGIAGETLTVTGLKGAFAQKDAGQDLSVAVDVTQARWDNANYHVNFPVITVTASITAADFTFAGVADQSVKIGNGMDTVNVAATATGVAGETVPGTVQWYSDPDGKRPLEDNFLFQGTEGDKITLYWSFSQKDDSNYSKAPVTGSTQFTLVSKQVPKLEAEGLSKVYDGKAVTLEDLPHRADVPGSWSLAEGTPELKNAGKYQVTLRFTPQDSRNYAEATCSVAVDIEYRNYYVRLKLSGNRISAGQTLPTASLVCTGALEGDDLHFDVEPVFTGMPQTSTAGSYAIRWENWREIADAIYKNPDARNYALQLQFLDTLTITDATVLPVEDEEAYRLEATDGLPEIPQSLRDAGLETVEAVLEEMFRYVVQKMPEATRQNTVLHDVTLYYSEDGGVTWVRATQENFPKAGIKVTLPYPAGTNATDFDFVVTHMLTVGTPGAVETPAVTKTDKGLQFTVYSLSPIAVSWKSVKAEQPAGQEQASAPAPTATPAPAVSGPATPYYICPACGYHDWTATNEGYRCDHCGYLESIKQLSGYGNVQGVYEPKSGSGAAAAASATIAQTGDASNPALWAIVAVVSAAVLGALLYFKRKNRNGK